MSSKTVRNIREPLKKPRPLKSSQSSELIKMHIQEPKDTVIQKPRSDILADLEILNVSISNCNFDEVTVADISRMCSILKKRGEELDSTNKEAMDRYFCTLRNASREDRLDLISRLKLLEVIETRAMHWKLNENLTMYFMQKFQELEQNMEKMSISASTSSSSHYTNQNQQFSVSTGIPLAPGEILRSSGKFSKPTKIAGKNYFKDEIVIRNSDSGKVNPGARDRLVQITGPHEEAIGHAKILVEDTIRRNASPVRENNNLLDLDLENREVDYNNSYSVLDNQSFVSKQPLAHSFSMTDASFREHTLPVYVGQDVLRISGTKLDLLKTARMVLIEYFAGQTELLEKHENLSSLHVQSPDTTLPRFELKRQFSLKDNLQNSTSWTGSGLRQDSASPFSSSEDDFGRDDKSCAVEQEKIVKDFSLGGSTYSPVPTLSDNASTTQTNTSAVSSPLSSEFMHISDAHDDLQTSDDLLLSQVLVEAPFIPAPSYKKHCYSRKFLLQCAESNFSHKQPADYVNIHQNFPEIICESPVMLDPSKYLEKETKKDEL